jgi:RimJ/RimL family protein N-acetyltransferase
LHQPPTGDRVVELKATGEFFGVCGINAIWLPMGQLPSFGSQFPCRSQPEVSMMWAIMPAHQGQGCATEVALALIEALFTKFNLNRVIATTEFDNRASQRVMEKVGMRLERNPFPDPFWLQAVGIIEQNPRSL